MFTPRRIHERPSETPFKPCFQTASCCPCLQMYLLNDNRNKTIGLIFR
ncbi:hypothetical protein NEIELOOT_01339 [Neisseria elongata subsp. glycolytica ATCC 29315]|uniref:Uncharacterized protein n=1 Tax=Neisseria elongata subsp. glycolytica ATCC 29315 TaxID=546263 RepID=D4DQK0_NEIEG|nr:hypothetical protein NEIELOOT_01339 [Neisseria elongata subsp. glycolytica ATCC 29315]